MIENTVHIPPLLGPDIRRGPLADLKRLPAVIIMVLLFMIVVFFWNRPLLGYNLSGIAWVAPCAFSLLLLARNFSKVTFPFALWLPWMALLFGYLALVDPSLLDLRVVPSQRTMQLLTPLLVGMAVSTWRPTNDDLRAFLATCRRLAYIILVVVGLMTGVLLTGMLPAITALAPHAITVTLLCTLFVNSYAVTHKREDIVLWWLLACIPIIALTRTAIAVSLLTFPLAFGPLRLSRRILAVILIAIVGLAVFNSERVQKKMFYSGKGSYLEINQRSDNFATSGRKNMWLKMRAAADEEILTGHGTGMGETFTYNITGTTAYPHNDWLLTLYDYGLLGVAIFAGCILLTIGHALAQARRCENDTIRILLYTGAGGFVPFVLMMLTDNIMIYASFFGNLHYIFLGLAYGALRARTEELTALTNAAAHRKKANNWQGNKEYES